MQHIDAKAQTKTQSAIALNRHEPVLLQEALALLNVQSDGVYIDATFGRGGHATEILNRLGENGHLFVLDRDAEAIAVAEQLSKQDARVTAVHGGFGELKEHIHQAGIRSGGVDGCLFDLGVSSPQVDDASRGFSFMRDGPLEMRMDPSRGISAAEWINESTEEDLVSVISRLGEERYARRIARAIVASRPLSRTLELARLVAEQVPARHHTSRKSGRRNHPATKTFQAVRLHVNQELEQLERALPQAFDLLATAGRLVVISFHSLEDRMVKRFMRTTVKGEFLPPDLPIRHADIEKPARSLGGLIRPSEDEVAANPRSRSARLRGIEKLELSHA